MPVDATDAEWRCPKCEGVLGMKSFGYEGEGDNCEKVRWVGEDGKWTETEPDRDFEIGRWYVVTGGLPLL